MEIEMDDFNGEVSVDFHSETNRETFREGLNSSAFSEKASLVGGAPQKKKKSLTAAIRDVQLEEDQYFGGKGLSADVEDGEDVIVKVENVHKTYLLGIEGIAALRGVSVSIKRGEFVCIYGTSGGGKTSLLNILGTIDKPTKGSLDICGVHVANKTGDRILADLRLHHIGFVFQTFNLLPALTAVENVELPMVLSAQLSKAERRERAEQLLEVVGLSHRFDHVPSQLSGGEQQRVAIARAMANKPDILLLDEPTGDLDTVNSALIMELLVSLNQQQGVTLIMVTHDVAIKFFADRVIWLRDGKIQRIEEVSEEKREESREKLNKQLHDVQERREEQKSRDEGRFKIKEDEGGKKGGKKKFIVRKPTDYKTHPGYVEGVATALTDFTSVV